MQQPTASLEFIELILQILKKAGLISKKLLASIDQDLAVSKSGNNRIPAKSFFLIWEKIENEVSDHDFGLHLGQRALDLPGPFLFLITHNASNVREGIEKFCKYHNIMNDMFNPELTTDCHVAMLSLDFSVPIGNQTRHIAEALICMYFLLLKKLSENMLKFKEIHFTHPEPEDISGHKAIFSVPLLFDQKENKIIFYQNHLNRPIFFANPEILKLLENHAQKLQQQYFSSPEWSGKVLQALLKQFPGHKPDIESVARSLAISTRSLQIKLKNEGANFKSLLHKVRKEMASNYLADPGLSLFEIACLLGYSDQSSFNRSFKQWTGASPMQYRLNLR